MALVSANQFQTVPELSRLGAGFQQGQQIRGGIDARQLAQQQQQAQAARQAQLGGLQQQVLAGQQPQVTQPPGGQGALLPDQQQAAQQQAQGLQAQRQLEQQFPEQALATQKATRARFENLELSEQTRINSVVKGALEVQGLPPEQQLARLTARRGALAANGIDTTDTDEVISLLQAGDAAGANALIDQTVQAGQGLGVLENTALEQAKVDIQKRNTELRELERQQRILDRDVSRETNRLRQQELQQKLDANQRKITQNKLERKFEADSAISNIDNSISTIDRMLEGTGLESAAGISAAFPTVPGSRAADFEALLETLQSQAFLSQVEKMKGLGALSENEGKKLGSAIDALDLSQSDEALRASLARIRTQFVTGQQNLREKFGQAAPPKSLSGLSAADLQSLTDAELEALAAGAQ